MGCRYLRESKSSSNRTDGQLTCALQTPHWGAPHLDRNLRFHIHLRLPAAYPGSPLKVNALSTHLPIFSHHLPELAETVYFDFLDLKSQNAPIKADVSTLRHSNRRHT